jgi:hypothetical protein
LDAVPYRGSLLVRESLGLLADRGSALGGLHGWSQCRHGFPTVTNPI